jgi:hypothetical protein
MNLSKSDLPHIKSGLIIFLCALAGGAAVLVYVQTHVSHAHQDQHTAQRQLNEAQHQLADVRNRVTATQDDQKNLSTYASQYVNLKERKIVGNEHRLDWIEGLDKIRKQNHVLDFTYAISPQRPYISPSALDNGNFAVNYSPMTLRLDLLHEGQMINFFNTLRTNVNGSFILEHCTVTRSDAAINDNSIVQLKAECSGGWLTLKNRHEK